MNRVRSIVFPIVLLVIATALLVVTVQFLIMFRGPPPGAGPPLPISRVAQALRSGEMPPGRERQMTFSRNASAVYGRGYERPSPARDAVLARLIGVPAGDVQGYYEQPPRDPENDLFGSWTIGLKTPSGWIIAASPERPAFTTWHLRRLLGMLATLIVLSLLAWLVAQRISRPLQRLADVARNMRLGQRQAIPREGPREVRELAEAIETMQGRILQQAEGRTAMLGAIAHDLGTPLSRIAFWIEQLPDEARERASADIDEMRAMLSATLRFARDDRAEAPHERLDLGSLIESLADDLAAAGTPVTVEAGPRIVVRGDSTALRRLFSNLIENAVRYGEKAALGWQLAGEWAEVTVDDAGPGFDPAKAEALFAPFVRGETSRNRATGGTGLGLAIVRSIAEAHGGKVTLTTRAQGGGRVTVRLPV